jgi:hypothetical protein
MAAKSACSDVGFGRPHHSGLTGGFLAIRSRAAIAAKSRKLPPVRTALIDPDLEIGYRAVVDRRLPNAHRHLRG